MNTCVLCGKAIQSGTVCRECAAVCGSCYHEHGYFEQCPTCGHQRERHGE